MPHQRRIVTTTEDTKVLDRERKRLKIGQIVHYQRENLKKVKDSWEKVSENVYVYILIIQV